MKDDEIDSYAHRLAHALPDHPPEAERPRQPFVIERVWTEGRRYTAAHVAVDDPDFRASFRSPGQYTTFQYGELDPRFLVIASAPDHRHGDRWEFLIDHDSDLGEEVVDVKAGDHVRLSPAEGHGYPAEGLGDRSVLIFATGAGIASMRPVLEFWRDRPAHAPQELAVYYGEEDRRDFAYVHEFADWRARGARVFQAVENLGEPTEGFRYVQHAFEADAPLAKSSLADTLVFVSGAPVMMELVIAKLMRLGVSPENIHINV